MKASTPISLQVMQDVALLTTPTSLQVMNSLSWHQPPFSDPESNPFHDTDLPSSDTRCSPSHDINIPSSDARCSPLTTPRSWTSKHRTFDFKLSSREFFNQQITSRVEALPRPSFESATTAVKDHPTRGFPFLLKYRLAEIQTLLCSL